MTPERWRQVEEILEGALSRGESERVAYLAHACAGDIALRRQVELLLEYMRLRQEAWEMLAQASREGNLEKNQQAKELQQQAEAAVQKINSETGE